MSAFTDRPAQAGRHIAVAFGIAAMAASLSAQSLLPSTPKKGFGASLTPAYDGWYANADGTRTLLVGYYNRNWNEATRAARMPRWGHASRLSSNSWWRNTVGPAR
jgi:hypothetical protein